MPGIFAYAAAINPTIVTGGTNGPAVDRGHRASLPAARAPAHNLPPACMVEPVTRRGEFQAVRRVFS
jgi:hypothetical protein